MARRPTKPKAKLGLRLAELRKAAGLTQQELADALKVSQSNIAFWEQSGKPPRSDILPKMARALEVSVETLLNGKGEVEIKRSAGPTGKVKEVFERVARLPRRQQERVIEFVSAFVEHYEQKKRVEAD